MPMCGRRGPSSRVDTRLPSPRFPSAPSAPPTYHSRSLLRPVIISFYFSVTRLAHFYLPPSIAALVLLYRWWWCCAFDAVVIGRGQVVAILKWNRRPSCVLPITRPYPLLSFTSRPCPPLQSIHPSLLLPAGSRAYTPSVHRIYTPKTHSPISTTHTSMYSVPPEPDRHADTTHESMTPVVLPLYTHSSTDRHRHARLLYFYCTLSIFLFFISFFGWSPEFYFTTRSNTLTVFCKSWVPQKIWICHLCQ